MSKNREPLVFALLLVFAILCAAMANIASVDANPFSQAQYSGTKVQSEPSVKPAVRILSPITEHLYGTNNISLSFNVTVPKEGISLGDLHPLSAPNIYEIYYYADFESNSTLIYHRSTIADWNRTKTYYFMGSYYEKLDNMPKIDFENITVELINIPDGEHYVTVVAKAFGEEYTLFHWYEYYSSGAGKADFSVDTAPPIIAVDSPRNQSYEFSEEIPLNYTVSERGLKAAYSLDGQQNRTLTGDIKISNLTAGSHNVTVYTKDAAGNYAVDMVSFSIKEQTSIGSNWAIAVVSVAVAAAGIGTVVYLKKLRH